MRSSRDIRVLRYGMVGTFVFAASLVAFGGCSSVLPPLPGVGSEEAVPDSPYRADPPGREEEAEAWEDRRNESGASDGSGRRTSEGPLTLAVVSDLNGRYGSKEYNSHVHGTVEWVTDRLRPDLVLSTGDHVAGQREGLDYAGMWDAFHRAVTRPLAAAEIPFAPTPGNHDASAGQSFERERRRYIREWKRRRPSLDFVGSGRFPLYYAFEMGPALFVSLDVTVPGPLPEAQMEWLRSVLGEHSEKPAKVVFAHLPLVPFAENRETEIIGDPEFEALLQRHGVDAMLSGHHHAYYPGRRGDIKMVGMACLGGGSRELIGTDRESRHSSLVMRIGSDGAIDLHARWGPEMQRTIDRRDLPRAIRHGGWTVRRIGTPRRLARNP